MKKILYCVFICTYYLSCQKDDVGAGNNDGLTGLTPDEIKINSEGTLLDGGLISDMGMYCLEHNTVYGELWYDYYPRTKTVSDYHSFDLCLMLYRDGFFYKTDDVNEMGDIAKMEMDYYKEKSSFIYDDYKNYKKMAPVGWPTLFTAYVNGEVTITCDKALYGQEPGTNLTPYFTMVTEITCLPIGVENPKLLYSFGDHIPTTMSKLFVDGTWLREKYLLHFSEQPSEKYDELTLAITLPMTKEHVRDYAVEKYKGMEPETKYSDAVYKSECKIKFNWK